MKGFDVGLKLGHDEAEKLRNNGESISFVF